MKAAVSALRFFCTPTRGRCEAAAWLTTVGAPRKLLAILSPEEVLRLLLVRMHDLPMLIYCALAHAWPACNRSLIIERSNSRKASTMWNTDMRASSFDS